MTSGEHKRFEVVVASMPAGADLTPDLALVKPALLYADHVRLFSPLATLLSGVAALGYAEGVERVAAIPGDHRGSDPPAAAEMAPILQGMLVVSQLPRAARRKMLGGKAAKEFRQHLEKFEAIWGELRGKVDQILIDARADELVPPIEKGLITIEPLLDSDGLDIEQMMSRFVDKIGSALSEGLAYPLFDDRLGELVAAGTVEGLFAPSPGAAFRAGQVGSAAGLLNHVPAFPPATVGGILDVRDELSQPLVRFRAAMVEVARLVDAAPHEVTFRDAIEGVYREKVAPALLEIREAIESSKYLTELLGEAVKDVPKWLGRGFVALATTPWSRLSEVAVAAATAAGSAAEPAARAAWNRYSHRNEIRQHQFFFLYETERLLSR